MGEKGAEGQHQQQLQQQQQQQQQQLQQQLLRRRQELDYHWKKNAPRLRRRNLLTGLAIGAFVVGMFSYTIVSVKQERIVEELDDEARIHISRGPRTSANS